MKIAELLTEYCRTILVESVFDVLGTIPDSGVSDKQRETLATLVMYVVTNNQRPGIMQLNSFYAQDNEALYAELRRLMMNHPTDFENAQDYVLHRGITVSKNLVRQFFAAKQNNVDLAPHPARPSGPQLPQRPVGGDVGRMRVAGRR